MRWWASTSICSTKVKKGSLKRTSLSQFVEHLCRKWYPQKGEVSKLSVESPSDLFSNLYLEHHEILSIISPNRITVRWKWSPLASNTTWINENIIETRESVRLWINEIFVRGRSHGVTRFGIRSEYFFTDCFDYISKMNDQILDGFDWTSTATPSWTNFKHTLILLSFTLHRFDNLRAKRLVFDIWNQAVHSYLYSDSFRDYGSERYGEEYSDGIDSL